MTALLAILAVAVLLLGVLVAGLLRSHAEILRALHGLRVGLDPDAADVSTPAPRARTTPPAGAGGLGPAVDLAGVTPMLAPIAVSVHGDGRLTLLSFLSSGCLTCRTFWDVFRDRDLAVPGDARLVVVTKGPDQESPAEVAGLAPPGVVTVMSTDAWDAYRVPGSPYFVLVDGERTRVVGEGTAPGWPQVERLVVSALADAGVAGVETGTPAPARPSPPSVDLGGRVDADLRAAGIGPGHPSLYATGDEPDLDEP